MCYYFKPCIKIKHIDIARHRYRLLVRGYKGFIAQRPQIGGHRDFNLSIYTINAFSNKKYMTKKRFNIIYTVLRFHVFCYLKVSPNEPAYCMFNLHFSLNLFFAQLSKHLNSALNFLKIANCHKKTIYNISIIPYLWNIFF